MEINEFLTWLFASGGNALVASWILERIPQFKSIADSEIKDWIYFGFTAMLSVCAYAFLNYVPAEIIAQLNPFFTLVYGAFISVFVGKAFHKIDKKSAVG